MLLHLCSDCYRAIETDKPCRWCEREQRKLTKALTSQKRKRKMDSVIRKGKEGENRIHHHSKGRRSHGI